MLAPDPARDAEAPTRDVRFDVGLDCLLGEIAAHPARASLVRVAGPRPGLTWSGSPDHGLG